MKKLAFIVFLLFTTVVCFSQPITPRANGSITAQDYRSKPLYNQFMPTYADTTAANLQKGIDSLGAVIYTYNTHSLWVRAYSSGKRWVEVAGGGGGGSSLLPTSGTGTATGNVTGDLNGNTLLISSSDNALSINPTSFTSSLSGGDGTASASFNASGDLVGTNVGFTVTANDGSNSVSIVGNAINETIEYTADSHTFNIPISGSFKVDVNGNTFVDIAATDFYSQFQSTDGTASGFIRTQSDLSGGNVRFFMSSNDGSNPQVRIEGDAQDQTIVYTSPTNSFTGNVNPTTDDTYTLGDNTHRWADIFLGESSVHIGTSTSDEGLLSYNTSTNLLSLTSTGAVAINKVTITSPATTATLTIANNKTLTVSNTVTFTATDGSTLAIGGGGTLGSNAYTSTAYAPLASPTFTGTVTIPTPFTLGAVSVTSTGTQLNYLNAATGTTGTTSTNIVFSTSPTLVTPTLGVATATSINKVTITAPASSSTLTVADGSSLITSGAFALTLTSTATSNATIPAGTNTLYSTKSSSITSSDLLTSLTNETGTGLAVFATSPTFTTSILLAGSTSGNVTIASDALSNAPNITTLSGIGYGSSTMISRQTSSFTMSDVNTVQPVFATTQDVWTLQASTTYYFEGFYYLTHGATSHSVGMSFELAGGASITSINYSVLSWPNVTVGTTTATQTTTYVNVATNVAINAAGANAAETIRFSGFISMNAGGTVTPSITFSAAPGGAPAAGVGTYITFTPIGTNTIATLGNVN